MKHHLFCLCLCVCALMMGNTGEATASENVFGLTSVAVPNPPAHPQYGTFTGIDDFETSLYNLALHNMFEDIEEDGTFRTGVLWGGVWTRDVSYSIILSLAHIEPTVSKESLLRKVDRLGRIIQDTGTGGAWPVSIDRQIWTVAAYELWLETGDEAWLKQIYDICSRSIRDDYATAYNKESGLFRGESSFIDWRWQSYPAWVDCKDICQSECLGTNAAFVGALKSLAGMAEALGLEAEAKDYTAKADALSQAINDNLWMADKGYYAQYRYGRNYRVVSPRSETLGESLCIMFGIASPEQAKSIIKNMPISQYGPTIFWPQIAGAFSYHNNAVWPFVTSYYAIASSIAGSHSGIYAAMNANAEYAALHGTNYENRVSSDGSIDTATNSPRQLWSLAGYMGTYRRIILGMSYGPEGITFSPDIPAQLKGERSLTGVKYRNMTLDITVSGEGNVVKSFSLDGEEKENAFIPATLEGQHTVAIEMAAAEDFEDIPVSVESYTEDCAIPAVAFISKKMISWEAIEGADHYKVLCNGIVLDENVTNTAFAAVKPGEYAVIAVKPDGVESFMSEPVSNYKKVFTFPADSTEIAMAPGVQYTITVKLPRRGKYAIDWLYSNGNGEIETQNKCAVRTMTVDGKVCDAIVLPQRGLDDWESQGWSNTAQIKLRRGRHTIELTYPEENINMNIDEDRAILHAVRFTLIK